MFKIFIVAASVAASVAAVISGEDCVEINL